MTTRELIIDTVRTMDAKRALVIAEQLRIRHGMNYRETVAFWQSCCRDHFDAETVAERYEDLMQEADAIMR